MCLISMKRFIFGNLTSFQIEATSGRRHGRHGIVMAVESTEVDLLGVETAQGL